MTCHVERQTYFLILPQPSLLVDLCPIFSVSMSLSDPVWIFFFYQLEINNTPAHTLTRHSQFHNLREYIKYCIEDLLQTVPETVVNLRIFVHALEIFDISDALSCNDGQQGMRKKWLQKRENIPSSSLHCDITLLRAATFTFVKRTPVLI